METPPHEVTGLLIEVRAGKREALDRLLDVVYKELRKLAASYLRHERSDHTLQPTALVNEAFLRLVNQHDVQWQNRAHFYGIAAQMMRRVLVDYARARRAEKRDIGLERVTLDPAIADAAVASGRTVDLLDLDAALEKLEKLDPRLCKIVELRYLTGLTNKEVAEVLGISVATVDRERVLATAWLRRELAGTV
jgi:RNA polymerase sigma factor (TIGR02999 family)